MRLALAALFLLAPLAARAQAVTAMDVPGLYPAFDPAVTDYAVAPTFDGLLPVTVTLGDPTLRLYVLSTPIASGRHWLAWAPPESTVDVVVYRDWTEVARYSLHVLPGWDAFAVDEAPPQADFVDQDEARRLYAAGLLEPEAADALAQSERRAAEDAATLRAFFDRTPGAEATFTSLFEGPDDVDGTRPFTFADRRGERRTVRLEGRETVARTLAGSLRAASSPDNALRIYAMLRPLADDPTLPDPREASRLSLDELKALNREILGRMDEIVAHRVPVRDGGIEASVPDLFHQPCVGGHPADVGDGPDFSDRQTFGPLKPDEVCAPSPQGIIANDDRDYTKHLGCIRDQANRGTCAAFALASAVESAYSRAFAVHVNLSEQKIYYRGKRAEGGLRDGLSTSDTLSLLASEAYTLPWEASWQYNPAQSRQTVPAQGPYAYQDSCVGYGETCSDTAHEGAYTCLKGYDPPLMCGWHAPADGAGVRLEGAGVELWDPDDAAASVDLIKAALLSGREVVLSLMVNDPFKAGVAGDGFVAYGGEDVLNYGSHAVHVVSFIDNDDLAALLPDAPPGDFGKPGTKGMGGYLIVRNSWGPCAGDGGYLYLPYRWLKPYFFVHGAVALDPDDLTPVP